MASFSESAHWRDSARNARFFMVDARAAFPLLLFLLHIQWWTLYVAVATMAFLGALENFGFTLPVFFRWLRLLLGGPIKTSNPWWRQ